MSKRTCSIDGCDGEHVARGWCDTHYSRWRIRRGDPSKDLRRRTIDERVWSRIDAAGDCWEWTGARHPRGYGEVRHEGRKWRAHRLVWTLLVGEIPKGLEIDHLCRNTGCVNPDHLEPVTHGENMRRSPASQLGAAKVRAKTHCPQGHPYDEENTYVYGPRKTYRHCRACQRERWRERRGRKA